MSGSRLVMDSDYTEGECAIISSDNVVLQISHETNELVRYKLWEYADYYGNTAYMNQRKAFFHPTQTGAALKLWIQLLEGAMTLPKPFPHDVTPVIELTKMLDHFFEMEVDEPVMSTLHLLSAAIVRTVKAAGVEWPSHTFARYMGRWDSLPEGSPGYIADDIRLVAATIIEQEKRNERARLAKEREARERMVAEALLSLATTGTNGGRGRG